MEDSGIGGIAAQLQAAPSGDAPAVVVAQQEVPGAASESGSNSARGSPMSQSIDDFTHVPPARMMSSVTKSQYSQVVFHDVCDLYPTDSDIKCRYTLTSDVSAQPGDKVAVFKVGWSSVSEYVTFERAPQPNEDGSSLSITFKAEKLPKDTTTLYQLCYVTSGNVIAGASTPFTFHVPTESELIAVEDPTDPGMVVFRSRVAQLQDDLQKRNEDYDQLSLKHRILEENMQVLKKELDKTDEALKTARETVTELFTNKQGLEIDNKVLQERLVQFQQESHTIGQLEEQLNQIKSEKEAFEGQLKELRIEYESIKRHFEENQKGSLAMKMENVDLVANVNKNYEMLQEKSRLVESQASTIKCLQQDCERSTQALKEQVQLVESLSQHSETLNEKLRTLAAKHNASVMENIELSKKCKETDAKAQDLQKENEQLKKVLQETFDAADPSNVHAARASRLEEEKEMLQAMLENLEEHHSKCSDKIALLTSQLRELNLGGAQSNERRSSEQNDPASSIFEVVRSVANNFGNLIVPPQESPVQKQPTRSGPPSTPSSEDSGYKGDEMCVDALKAKLHQVRQQKSELSTQLVSVRHNLSEIHRDMSELKQDNSSKKNRIEVLELELRAAKDELLKIKKRKQDSEYGALIGEHIEALTFGLPVISKFNEQVGVLSQLQQKMESERSENAELKRKVVDLLMKDAEMCSELQETREKYDDICEQLETLKKTSHAETIEMISRALDDSEFKRKDAETKLQQELENKAKLEQQVTTLRAECVGKVSVDCSRKMQEHINSLELKLEEMNKFSNYTKKFIHYTFDERRNKPINCPLCPTEFPYTADKKFAAHFKDQHMK
uniref:Tax1-binding protein 1 B n=2 Tax=Lygus hesperus TaxID=30085 RepID=A0A0A9X3V0_LYGHE